MLTWLLTGLAFANPTATVTTIDEPIRVDGVLDEAAWAQATPVTDFQRYLPSQGGAPEGTTEAAPEALPIDWSTEPTAAYVNGAHVVHSPSEFAVLFTEMSAFPGRHSATGEAGDERAAVAASIRTNPTVFFEMLCVFTSNWNRYANEMIDPRMRRPRFKLLDAGEFQLEGLPPSKD